MGSSAPFGSEGGGGPTPEQIATAGGAVATVLGFGGGDGPSPRDIRRSTPAQDLLARLTAKLATRTKPESRKYQRNVRRLAAAQDVVDAAIQLGIDPGRKTGNVIRAIRLALGLEKFGGLRALERGRGPDLSVLARAHAAAAAQPTTPGLPQPSPVPQPTTAPAPPGLPPNWWDWQLWQRALYGLGTFAGLFGRERQATSQRQPRPAGLTVPRPPPPAVFEPQPAPPPGAATTVGEPTVPFHDVLFGSVGSIDFGGLIEQGLDVFQDYYYGSINDPGPGGAPLPGTRSPSGTFQTAGLGPAGGAVLGGLSAAALEAFFGGENGDPSSALFRATDARIIPRSRIDAVGPDGRNYTWLRAVPYGWKVRGTKVGGRRRHHHHYRKR